MVNGAKSIVDPNFVANTVYFGQISPHRSIVTSRLIEYIPSTWSSFSPSQSTFSSF